MKRLITAGTGTMSQFINQVENRIDQLEGQDVEMSTDIEGYDDIEYDEDDEDIDEYEENRLAAIEYLRDNTNLDLNAAEFVVDEYFNDDLLQCAKNLSYLMYQYTDEEWYDEGIKNDFDPDHNTIIQDAAFNGVVVIEG